MPYAVLGPDSYIRIHDTLEGEMVWLHMLKQSGYMHSISNDIKLMNIMDGLPRNVLPSGFTFLSNMCNMLDIFYGYILSQYVFKTIGYMSFYLFIKRYMTLNYLTEFAIVFVSLLMTSIQFFTPFGLSVMGMPLMAYGFARLYYREDTFKTYLIFFFFPFFSSFVWSGIELIILFNLYILYLLNRKKNTNIKKWILAWIVFIAGTILANIQFIYGMLFLNGFRSHRVLYNQYNDVPNFQNSIVEFFSFFFSVHYHISIFVSTLIFAIYLIAYYGVKKNKWAYRIMWAIGLVVAWQAIYPYVEYATQSIVFIKSFRFNRFAFLLPFLWFLVFLISLDTLARVRMLKKTIPLILATQFFIFYIANDESVHNYKKLFGNDDFPSFNEYMANKHFKIIEKIIPKDNKQKIISLGLSPTIAQYHNYPTLDGLFSVYSLEYKDKFRQIMTKELDKNPLIKASFDTWGNRCYLFSSELGLENVQNCLSAHDSKKVQNLEINTAQIKNLGGKYIFSAVEILNYKNLKLNYLGSVGDQSNFWKIYLYQL